MSNMSKTQLINSDASANTNSANSHIELVPGGSAETGPDSVSSTHTQVTNLTSTTVNGPSTSSSSSSPREERLAPPITSADLDSQPVQNILSSVSVQSTSGVCLQVELHDGTVYNVDSKDNPTVVEDLCIQLLKRYFPKMGPAAVQLFGLASIDKKQIPKMLWVNPCITIEELKRHILNSPTAGGKNTFFLRIRYVPRRKFLHNLPALGPEILKYLYLQCKDDFVKSRLSDIYEQDIKNEAKARGYAVLSIVIASKMEEKDCQDILNKQKLEAFLPSHLVVRLWRGYQLRKNMKTKTEEFLAQHSNTKVEELLMGYIKDVLNEVQSYGVERYEAKKVSGSLRPVHITLDVQQHEENGNTQYKGLFIDNEFFSSIDDFRSIHITPNHADQKKLSWNVHLDRSNGCPEVLRFDSKTVAESFVSGVNGYYRLITDYYMNLSQQMELPSLQEINRLKCHGPIDTSTAVRKLKTKDLSDEYYILKQSMQVFDQLAILFCYGGQTRKRLIDKKENMYCLEGENEEEFKDINCLIKYMAETRNLLPKRPIKVKPQQEPVDVLRKLFVEEIIPDDDEEAAMNNQRRKPYIILPEEIKIKELIERGTFTEVFVCDLESGTLHAAKRLRQTSNDQMFRCYEHFQHAVQQLIRMEDPKFFVRVHGLVLSTPPMLVMEKAQYGSLASFFRRRQTSQPIKPFHLLNAASQVAQGMLFLNEHQLVHGNLCCRNLLVFRYEIDDILVKIGDPGMVSLMNSLDLSLPQNRSRLLFLAPELYPDCRKCDSKMTQQSDVFAFGTTLWEMFAHGQNPVETRKLKNLSNLEILQTPAHTRLDPPRSLDEATEWKRKVLDLMSLCWKPVEDRPAPNLLLRDLRTQVADYDSSQRGHGYSSIRREFEDDIQDQGRDGNAVPDLISSTQESQPLRPMLSPTLPPVNAAFIPPAPFMPTPSRASLNTESLSNKAGGVYNRSLPELPLDFKYIISSRRLQIQEKQLGSGHYGVVKEGMLFASQDDRSNPQKIAAKELKGDFQNVIDSEEFKEEAVLMSKLEHDNVVKFLGISDNMLILEYVEKGALNMYLRKFRKQNTYLPVWRLMKMISDVAQGMAYLASMRVIHCDLAGRNVLLTDKLVAKITDFGLAKILQKDKDYYTRSTGKELPLMWCSPESIANRKFTTKGDIWSYGILMWEVFTHAKPPVLCSNFSKEGFKKLEEGKRLKRPTHCPELVYQFMEKCWKFKPEERPDFNEACQSCREFAKIYPEPEQRVPDIDKANKQNLGVVSGNTSVGDQLQKNDTEKSQSPIDNQTTHLQGSLSEHKMTTLSSGCSDEYVVRRLFVFIKDNLIFESLQDGLMQKKLLSEREKEEYVISNCARHYWSERLLKLIIRKERCKEFVAFIHQMACHKHVSEKIMEVQEKAQGMTMKAANGAMQRRINLTLTHELLQRHFACLYMGLEPREIADEMFQAGHLTVFDHDNVTESNQRYKRLSFLLHILMKKELYAQLVCTLQSLGYRSVLDTLQKDRKLKNKPSEYSTCIQHNFILLQENIPCFGDARFLMEHELDSTNISDIESCKNAVRKISKLLKILLIRGKPACKEFFRVIEVDLKREDLIQKMKYKSAEIKRRGKPNLNQRHRSLRTPCLQEHGEFLNEELEPLDISDLLFEEGAMEISAHDKITETSRRQKQVKYLLETVNGNENDCFHFFLYILQKEGYESILEELKKSAPGAVGAVPHEQSENLRLSIRVAREPDDVVNGDIHMRLSVGGRTGPQVEQVLQDSYSSGTEILEEAILHGVVDIRGVSSGSIVLQLRPVTDQAVQTLLNVRDNNRLVEMIVGMLKKVNIVSMMDGTEPLEIKVQVYKANPVGVISKAEDAEPIKKRLKAHRNVLVSELEPRAIAHVLSKSKAFAKSAIDSVLNAESCNDRVENLLSLVEDGDSEVVKEFVTALKDLGYSSIVELIDPPDIHNRAENIRKIITSNYKNILEEMRMKLAKETLSKCVGDVDEIREKILPKNGNRKKRMSSFLQFILQDDHNVIEFEKMLRNNDLEDLLKIDENVQGEHIPTQGIELMFVEDRIHSSSEGLLFEAVITLSQTVKSDRKIQQKVGKVSEETGGQQGETGGQQGETGAKQLDIDFEKMHLDESPLRPQRLDMAPTSPDIPLKGNESISSVSSSTSLKSIFSDAEEDKNSGKTFTKNVPSLKKKKNVVKTFGHEERFDPQKEADVPLPPVRKSALYDEISKKGADFAGSLALPTYQTVLSQTYKLVAAIDFGTTYSGYAFSLKKDPANFVTLKSSSSDKLSEKEPSVLLMDRSEHLVDFGQEAVLKYKEFCEKKLQQDYFYFSNFKMTLHRNENLSRKTIIQDDKGRECLAVTVFSLSIKYFKERLLRQLDKSKDHCSDEDIRWVLTVPAIWGEQAKQLMQESAEMAGISQHKLMLALEPEVAAVFVKEIQIERQADELSKYRPGKKFLVMDLGGGTADLTAMEVVDDGSLKQLHRACGGDWGGNKVNDNFFKFLGSLFGHSVIKECEERYRSDFLDLQKEIEVMKRKFGKGDYMYNSPPKFQIPYMYQTFIKEHHEMELKAIVANSEFSQDAFLSDNGKLKLSAKLIETLLFNPVVNCIKQETENVLHELRGQIQDIMMVGGFSESEFVYQTIKESFPRTKLLRANEAGLAVLKGAVLYGHSPGVISFRRCAFTYGVGLYRVFLKDDPEDLKCKIQGEDNISVFVKMVTVGDEVGIAETFDLDEDIFPVKKNAPQMSFKIYRSALDNPVYIDESSIQIGKLTVKNITSSVRISLCFGLTQITVMAVNTDTKENAIAELDLLGEL